MDKCDWKHTPFTHHIGAHIPTGQHPGFADEWAISCVPAPDTLRIEPRPNWKLCPYCGKEINWLSNPADPSLPQTIPRLV